MDKHTIYTLQPADIGLSHKCPWLQLLPRDPKTCYLTIHHSTLRFLHSISLRLQVTLHTHWLQINPSRVSSTPSEAGGPERKSDYQKLVVATGQFVERG